MKTYKLHFIRHGFTDANVNAICAGTSDYTLNDEGRIELKELLKNHDYPYAERYFCSPLTRCRQTMDILYPDAVHEIVEGLHEQSFGEFEGRAFADIATEPAFQEWMSSGGKTAVPGGESIDDVLKRTSLALDSIVKDIMSKGQLSAVICTHGGVMMALLSAYGLPQLQPKDYMFGNGRGVTVRITPSIWMREGKFEVMQYIPPDDAFFARGKQAELFKEFLESKESL